MMKIKGNQARIRVRRARRHEARLLSSVAREAKASWGYPDAWMERWADELTITESYIGRHTVWAAEEGPDLLGFAALERMGDQVELAHLWVRPVHQGRGVGRSLVSTAAEYAAEWGFERFRVVSDPNAATFYERLGGTRVGWEDAGFDGVSRLLPVLHVPVRGAGRVDR